MTTTTRIGEALRVISITPLPADWYAVRSVREMVLVFRAPFLAVIEDDDGERRVQAITDFDLSCYMPLAGGKLTVTGYEGLHEWLVQGERDAWRRAQSEARGDALDRSGLHISLVEEMAGTFPGYRINRTKCAPDCPCHESRPTRKDPS